MPKPKECPKCQGSMSAGFVVDRTQGGAKVASWVDGEPQKSFWVGVRLGGKTPIEIVTWRCKRCGFLESYAGGS